MSVEPPPRRVGPGQVFRIRELPAPQVVELVAVVTRRGCACPASSSARRSAWAVPRPDQRAGDATDAVDLRVSRRAARTERRMDAVTVRNGFAAEYTLSGPRRRGHRTRSIHYSPVLPVQCAGEEELR